MMNRDFILLAVISVNHAQKITLKIAKCKKNPRKIDTNNMRKF